MLAQQRAAKMRAAAEVSKATNARTSTSASSSSLTGGVRSKILHHGAAKTQQYIHSGLPQSGVPMRLSQNEIDENDDDGDALASHGIHRRTDSGRSSLGSAGRGSSTYGQQAGGTPPSGLASAGSTGNARHSPRSEDETPVPGDFKGTDYFAPSTASRTSSGSANGSPEEKQFGELGKLPVRTQKPEEEEKLSEAELRRRGSVDERTMTMSGYGKLFIANPDD